MQLVHIKENSKLSKREKSPKQEVYLCVYLSWTGRRKKHELHESRMPTTERTRRYREKPLYPRRRTRRRRRIMTVLEERE